MMLKPCILIGVLLASAARGGLSPQRAAAIDAAAASELARQELVGLAIGIVQDGEVLLAQGYGLADKATETPVSSDTLFRWASISKPLTAVVALQLAQRDQLDLDADIRQWVPEFPAQTTSITTRQLLGHLGGIVHYGNGPVIGSTQTYEAKHPYEDVVVALDRFKGSPLVARPGTAFAYSTHGYILASAVVQRAGNAKFAEQVQSRIAAPLGMKTLRPDYQWEDIPGRATGYRKWLGVIVESTDTDVSWKLGGGGWISNIDDLARFAAGLLGEQLLEEVGKAEMSTTQRTADGERTGYGLGLGVSSDGEVLSHSGSQAKTRTLMLLYPETGEAIVVMTNSEYADVRSVAKAVREAMKAADSNRDPFATRNNSPTHQ